MSYDRRLEQVCTHAVVEEPLYLNIGRQIVKPLRPIAAVGTVKVLFNGELDAPSYGVGVPAQATGSRSEPFTIQAGVNDRLVISVGNSTPQVLTLPSGRGLSASQLSDSLNRSIRQAIVQGTSKNQLRIRSLSRGSLGTLFIQSNGSTAASTLGLPTNRCWRGKDILPGWTIVNDPNTLSDRPTRYIIFDQPLKGYTDYVEVSYTTVRQECRRCGGIGIEHDWRYDSQGNLVTIQGQELLLQEVMKIIYTVLGSNKFHSWYGTNVVNAVGKKLTSTGIAQNMILNEINDAFRRWQTVKRQQEENIGQLVTDEEYPYMLSGVNLQQSEADPTVVVVSTIVQSRSNKAIEITRAIKTPMPEDLLGSTQQQQIFSQTTPNYNIIQG